MSETADFLLVDPKLATKATNVYYGTVGAYD